MTQGDGMPEYGVKGVVPGRVGCAPVVLLVVASALVGQVMAAIAAGIVTAVVSADDSDGSWLAGGVGAVVWLAVTVVGSWWSIRTVARRRAQTVYWCARCGVQTDPAFDVCRSCGRLKSP